MNTKITEVMPLKCSFSRRVYEPINAWSKSYSTFHSNIVEQKCIYIVTMNMQRVTSLNLNLKIPSLCINILSCNQNKKLIKTGQMVDDRNANIAALTNGQQRAGILLICASCNIKEKWQPAECSNRLIDKGCLWFYNGNRTIMHTKFRKPSWETFHSSWLVHMLCKKIQTHWQSW